MQTIFTKLDPHQSILSRPGKPIYISTEQFRDAYYIPEEDRSRIIIVDFKEDANGTNSFTKNDSCS
jgi:hypothetical protein